MNSSWNRAIAAALSATIIADVSSIASASIARSIPQSQTPRIQLDALAPQFESNGGHPILGRPGSETSKLSELAHTAGVTAEDKIPSPFRDAARGAKPYVLTARPVAGAESVYGSIDLDEFNLARAQMVATVAGVEEIDSRGLAGKILDRITSFGPSPTKESVIGQMDGAMRELGTPPSTLEAVLARAKSNKEFKPEKPRKLVEKAVKDVVDSQAKRSLETVTQKIGRLVPFGLTISYGASEGAGQGDHRDNLSNEDAIPGGTTFRVEAAFADIEGVVEPVVAAIGLRRLYFSLIDVVDNTNAAVGVTEQGVLYKNESDIPVTLRPYVQLVDYKSATHPQVTIEPKPGGDFASINTDDGYAHAILAVVPKEAAADFHRHPLDPDDLYHSLQRLCLAWGPGSEKAKNLVVMMNRPRERLKVLWFAAHGFEVHLIPDGTLTPTAKKLITGELGKGFDHTIVWTTAGAAEAGIGISAQKAMAEHGVVGAIRLMPGGMPADGWLPPAGDRSRWKDPMALSGDDIGRYFKIRLRDATDENSKAPPELEKDVAEFNASVKGKFNYQEIKKYQAQRPMDWENVVMRNRILTIDDVPGDVDFVMPFSTGDSQFSVQGVRHLENGEIEIDILHVTDRGGHGRAVMETIRGDMKQLANGDAAIAWLHERFVREWKLRHPANPLHSNGQSRVAVDGRAA